MTPAKIRTLLVVLAVTTTLFASFVTALQADSSTRADKANRDSQLAAMEAFTAIQEEGLSFTFNMSVFYDSLTAEMESTALELAALELQAKGDLERAEALNDRAAARLAASERLRPISILYTDERYAPTEEGAPPNLFRYLRDRTLRPSRLGDRQNELAGEYHRWSSASDTYAAVLTILTVALFLLGLAQAVPLRLRLPVGLVGAAGSAAASAWAVFTFVTA